MRRALILSRQSVADDDGHDSLSLESQEAELRARCVREGWTVVAAVRESGIKGWAELDARPGLSEAVRRAEAGDLDILLVWDASRLARSVRILETVVHRLERHGVTVVSHTEEWVSSPMLRQVVSAVAEERTRETRRHVKRAIYARVAAGAWHGRCPIGYRVTPKGGLVVDPDAAPIVREVAARIAAGQSYQSIADDLNVRGVPTAEGGRWHATTIRNIGTTPTYTGRTWIGETAVDGAHEALICPETWAAIQARLSSGERAGRPSAPLTWLSGFARCGCGTKLYPVRMVSTRKGRSYPHVLLRCGSVSSARVPCNQPRRSVALGRAEAFVRAQLAADLAGRVPWRDAYRRVIAERATTDGEAVARERAIRRQVHACETAIRKLDDAYFGGPLERGEWERRRAILSADLATATAALATVPTRPSADAYRDAERTMVAVASAVRVGAPADLRAVLTALGAVLWLRDGGLRLSYAAPFDGLLS